MILIPYRERFIYLLVGYWIHRLGTGGGFSTNLLGGSRLLLVKRTDGEGSKSLHKASSVVGARSLSKGKHGLCELSVVLGVGVAQGRLNVNKLLDVVKVSVHLNNLAVRAEVVIRVGSKLDSRGRGGKLSGGRGPLDLGALVEEVGGDEVLDTLLLDASDTKSLLVFLVKVGGENLNDHIGELLLGVNVGIEVGLTGLNGSHDGFERVSTLFHVTLDLPVKLDIRGDVEVKGEVKEVTDAVVVHGVKTLEDDDRSGLDLFGGVKSSVDVVVDGLLNSLSLLEGLDLLVHEVEVVLEGVKGSALGYLTSLTVVKMVVIEADDGGEVGNKGVGLPASVVESATKRSNYVSSEDVGKTTHEGGLSATRVSGNTDDNGGLSRSESHLKAARGRSRRPKVGRNKGRRGEGGGLGEEEGGNKELHGWS